MSSLLARFAENIFWLGRYMERAENLARILDTNETYARNKEGAPDWLHVLDLHSDRERFYDFYQKADAQSILTFYILDRDNPGSIVSTVTMARQNAKSVRHLISTEMWTHINVFYNDILKLTQRDIWLSNLSRVCSRVKENCQTFEGVAEGTFQRSEPWCFYILGKYIERADQTTRILDMGFERISQEGDEAIAPVHKNVLLRSVSGYHAFRGQHPAAFQLEDIVTFLLHNEEFPRAVALCVKRITERLGDLQERHKLTPRPDVEKARRSLEFKLLMGLDESITPKKLNKFLDGLQIALDRFSTSISNAYFAY